MKVQPFVDEPKKTHGHDLPRIGLGGRLAENIMHFGRVLRRAGLPIGTGQVIDAINAVTQVGLKNRGDFYWTLYSVFVNRGDQQEIFDQAFHIFWRNPEILEKMMQMVLPDVTLSEPILNTNEIFSRVSESFSQDKTEESNESDDQENEFDAALTWSSG